MFCIKPGPENYFFCPKCFQPSELKQIAIRSAFTLGDCFCRNCGCEFSQTLPIGHTVTETLTIDRSEWRLYPGGAKKSWLTEALLKAHRNERKDEVRIEKIVNSRHERVVVLNTLDFLYGHVLLKLYNSIFHLDHTKDLGLVVIVPKSFAWLIPDGCAEVWTVDLKLCDLAYSYAGIQEFVSKEFARFETIYFSNAYSHPDFTGIDISRFTEVRPFGLAKFSRLPPSFTFVLREDRWWFRSRFDYWFYRLCRKLGILKLGSRYLSRRQNGLVKETISLILKQLPEAKFCIVGLGVTGNFKGYARDERRNVIDDTVEREWCGIYARSHAVLGVHGSNMLLPTAHAAGCVEILPQDRYGNMVQDLSIRYSGRMQLYLYRFADQYSAAEAVADKVLSMIENFEIFKNNMCQNVYSPKPEPMATMIDTTIL